MTLVKGQVIGGRYRIVSLLKQGGMGAVYRAWDTRLNVLVALKEMTPQSGLDPYTLAQLRQQFQQEATVLARLNHPHLVDVTDFFEEGGNAYLVMRFIEGESLANRIEQEGPLPEAQVLTWAGQLLDALAYCHSQGIIHRDIKPQNVVITPEEQAVLVDFGLVKLWDPRDPRTKTAMRGMATPEYAPPEQYSIRGQHTDPRSDIYSLGATLYHALTGQAPLMATDRTADPDQFVPVRGLVPCVSLHAEAAVLRALEIPRGKRFQSAPAMAMALSIGAPNPVSLTAPPPITNPTPPPVASRPGPLSISLPPQISAIFGRAKSWPIAGAIGRVIIESFQGSGGAIGGAIVGMISGAVFGTIGGVIVGTVDKTVIGWLVRGAIGGMAIGTTAGLFFWEAIKGMIVGVIRGWGSLAIDDTIGAIIAWELICAVVGAIVGAIVGTIGAITVGALVGAIVGAIIGWLY